MTFFRGWRDCYVIHKAPVDDEWIKSAFQPFFLSLPPPPSPLISTHARYINVTIVKQHSCSVWLFWPLLRKGSSLEEGSWRAITSWDQHPSVRNRNVLCSWSLCFSACDFQTFLFAPLEFTCEKLLIPKCKLLQKLQHRNVIKPNTSQYVIATLLS